MQQDSRPPARIGLVIALEAEVPAFLPRTGAPGLRMARTGAGLLGLVVSGIGRTRARVATQRLWHEFAPDYFMSLGMCGAVDDRVQIGEAVLAGQVAWRTRLLSPDCALTMAAQQALDGKAPYHLGKVQTCDRVVMSRRRLQPAVLAVDMECYAVVETAQALGLPSLVVKVASDIVPMRAGPASAWRWLTGLKRNFASAKAHLDLVAALCLRV